MKITYDLSKHIYQSKVFNSTKRFILALAGNQAGKTFIGSVWMLNQSREYPKDYHLICAPYHKVLMQATLVKFFEIAPFYKKYYRKQDQVIDLPQGGKIFIRSADLLSGLEGMTLRSAWLDEASAMKSAVWIIMQTRVGFRQGKILLTTTPTQGTNWIYHEVYRKWEQGDPNYDVIQWRAIDNPYYPKKEYFRAKKDIKNKKMFEMRYLGKFTKMENLVYEEFSDEHIVKPFPGNWVEVIAGIDWAFNQPSAIAVIASDKDNNYYLIDEFYEARRITAELVEEAMKLQRLYNIRTFYADSAEPDRIQEFNNANLYTRPAEKDIIFGIDKVRNLVRRKQFKVFERCVNAIDEFETYSYPYIDEYEQKGIGKKADKPISKKNHLLDAIRYALYFADTGEQQKEAEVIKPIFQQY